MGNFAVNNFEENYESEQFWRKTMKVNNFEENYENEQFSRKLWKQVGKSQEKTTSVSVQIYIWI